MIQLMFRKYLRTCRYIESYAIMRVNITLVEKEGKRNFQALDLEGGSIKKPKVRHYRYR